MTLQNEIKSDVIQYCYSIQNLLDDLNDGVSFDVSEFSTLIINTGQIHAENIIKSVSGECDYDANYIKVNLEGLIDIIENIELIADSNQIADYSNKSIIFNDIINRLNDYLDCIYDLVINVE
jgi:hypothetical protein